MKKRILSIMLALCVVMALLPTTVFATETLLSFSSASTVFTYSDEQIDGKDKGWLNDVVTITVHESSYYSTSSEWIPNTEIGVTVSYDAKKLHADDYVTTLKIIGKPNSEYEEVLLGYIKFTFVPSDGEILEHRGWSHSGILKGSINISKAGLSGYLSIPVYVNYTHTHTDKNPKDHICDVETCKAKLSDHSGGTATCKDKAVCDYCGGEYGEKDSSNHTGGEEIRDAKEATCTEDGYTGDIWCLECGNKSSIGTVISATGIRTKTKTTTATPVTSRFQSA